MITMINDDTFEAEVLKSEEPVLVDFFADWCGPCQMLAPVIEEIAEEADGCKICKLNVDQSPNTAVSYRVASIPTLIVFKNGQAEKKAIGFQSKSEILQLIQEAKEA